MASPVDPPQQASVSRRCVLQSLALAPLVGALPAARAAAHCNDDADWIPGAALLADLPRLMQALSVPGLAMAVVDDDRVAWSHAAGVLHAGEPRAVDARTLFEAASLSKPVFAYLVLLLVDDGTLQLDRPLVAYVRPDYLGDDPRLDRITVRDVLRHSTGLPNWRAHPATEPLLPAVEPGTRIDYSGEAIFWLQLAVEAATGQALDRLAHERLFVPAGMRDSTYAWDADAAARSVRGHAAPDAEAPAKEFFRDTFDAALPLAREWDKPIGAWRWDDAQRAWPQVAQRAPAGSVTWAGDVMSNAAASLRCTATDYARFMALCVPHRHRQPWELREATRTAMLTPQLPLPGRWSQKTLGWNVEDTRIGPVFFHSGSNGDAFKAFAIGDTQRGRALVALTNSGSGALLYRRIVRDATGLDLLAFDI